MSTTTLDRSLVERLVREALTRQLRGNGQAGPRPSSPPVRDQEDGRPVAPCSARATSSTSTRRCTRTASSPPRRR